MANTIDSCKDTGSTLDNYSSLAIMIFPVLTAPWKLSQEAMAEAFDSITGLFHENGISAMITSKTQVMHTIVLDLSGDIPDDFARFLTSALDVMLAGTGPIYFHTFYCLVDEDEVSEPDKTKVVKVEDFLRVFHDTLGMMAGVEIDEDDS